MKKKIEFLLKSFIECSILGFMTCLILAFTYKIASLLSAKLGAVLLMHSAPMIFVTPIFHVVTFIVLFAFGAWIAGVFLKIFPFPKYTE